MRAYWAALSSSIAMMMMMITGRAGADKFIPPITEATLLLSRDVPVRRQRTMLIPPFFVLPKGSRVYVMRTSEDGIWTEFRTAFVVGWAPSESSKVPNYTPLRFLDASKSPTPQEQQATDTHNKVGTGLGDLTNWAARPLSALSQPPGENIPEGPVHEGVTAAPKQGPVSIGVSPKLQTEPESATVVALRAAPSPSPTAVAQTDRPTLSATRTTEVLILDGRLDEGAWSKAVATDAFTQKFPREGQSPSERTVLRVLYDDTALYIGFESHQERAPITKRMTRRDRQEESDWVSVNIGTRQDRTSAFEFMVSAAGVLVDGLRYNDTEYTSDWDEVWDARVHITDHGWSAEFRIPLHVLRFDALPKQSWDFQARRYISHLQETEEWSPISRNEAGEVSRYGLLDNLVNLTTMRPLEWRPYLSARVQWADGVLPAQAPLPHFSGIGGLDVKWHITPNLTMNATLNPDFAQVEVDQVLLNLSNYELSFPEKRSFMLDGTDAFATPLPLLYTRRIGAAPASMPDLPFTERAEPAQIYGALKLVGKLGPRLTIGLLSALTGQNDVPFGTGGSSLQVLTLDQMASFNVLRLKYQIASNAHLGFFGGAVARFEQSAQYQATSQDSGQPGQICPDGTVVAHGARCSNDAFVLALDGRWRSPRGTYLLSGQGLLTALHEGPPRMQRDGTLVRPGPLGFGGQVRLAKEAGEHWSAYAEVEVNGQNLDYNDLGFMRRQNLASFTAQFEFHTLRPWWKTNETRTWILLVDQETLTLVNLAREISLGTRWRFANFWSTALEFYYRAAHFDDREIGNGVALERSMLWGGELTVASDPRRRFSFEISPGAHYLPTGYNLFGLATLSLRLLSRLDVQLIPAITQHTGEPRYVCQNQQEAPTVCQANSYMFGRLYATSVGATVRSTVTFTSRLTLQLYAQLFMASRHYRDFSVFRPSPAATVPKIRQTELIPIAGPSLNPDSQETILNLSAVLRWEFLLGSTIFLVYTRAGGSSLQGQPSHLDLGALSSSTASNSFLLKLTYWWN